MKNVILLLFIFMVVSCGSVQYGKASGTSAHDTGYSDYKLKKNMYRVKFQGNGNNSPDNVYMLFLRRSAELGREIGYKYFIVSDDNAGAVDNGPVSWPYHQGNILYSNVETEESFIIEDILKGSN